MTDITLYSRADCHLCDAARQVIEAVAGELRLRLTVIDIDTDAALRARYDHAVPVVTLAGREIARYRIDVATLRQAVG